MPTELTTARPNGVPATDTLWQSGDVIVRVRVILDEPSALNPTRLRVSGAWANADWTVRRDGGGGYQIETRAEPLTFAANADVDPAAETAKAVTRCVLRTARLVANQLWAQSHLESA